MKKLLVWISMLAALVTPVAAVAAADLEINTPAISALKGSMQQRHAALAPYYTSGALGLARDGQVAVRDAGAIPLSERQKVNSLVAEENRDRSALYREIARANGHPEWEEEVRSTFAGRWIDKAQPGWWVQTPGGGWARK